MPRTLRHFGLRRGPAHAGNRGTHRSGRAAARCPEVGRRTRGVANLERGGNRSAGGVWRYALAARFSLRGKPDRPTDFCGDCVLADCYCATGLLLPRASRDEGRSAPRASTRISAIRFLEMTLVVRDEEQRPMRSLIT